MLGELEQELLFNMGIETIPSPETILNASKILFPLDKDIAALIAPNYDDTDTYMQWAHQHRQQLNKIMQCGVNTNYSRSINEGLLHNIGFAKVDTSTFIHSQTNTLLSYSDALQSAAYFETYLSHEPNPLELYYNKKINSLTENKTLFQDNKGKHTHHKLPLFYDYFTIGLWLVSKKTANKFWSTESPFIDSNIYTAPLDAQSHMQRSHLFN